VALTVGGKKRVTLFDVFVDQHDAGKFERAHGGESLVMPHRLGAAGQSKKTDAGTRENPK